MHFEGLEKNKQEWSFTLYDFDGHGKITREVNSNKVESVTLEILNHAVAFSTQRVLYTGHLSF